ncbi:hypothetical protein [Actinomadura chibensis]|uniref:Uncharacterized protein n=1 Tax=Actinomadura chibensis TaxID=392828 RepID=A0A5D0NKR8_9ACTN|nr:hypothetical protein [Actinomadura chibensis]TYB44899.1 hypothetical protein FXF69_22465 [Actinomadura chibensis]
MTISHDGAASFERLEPSAVVRHITAISQSLDNQWLSQSLLAAASERGRITKAIEAENARQVRTEYLRTLLNAEKAIVNRAYFYNNPEVFRDFLDPDSRDYEAFRGMVEERTIIPFLLFEDSPVVPPGFARHRRGWEAWLRVASDVELGCLRLSWDTRNNELAVQRMFRKFHEYFQNLNQMEPAGLKRDFGLDDDGARALSDRLTQVGNLVFEKGNQRERVTREFLYQQAVAQEGTDVSKRLYRWDDPLALATKQIVDLKYNTNLGDALQVYSLTPSDSLRRSALQEDVRLVREGVQEVDAAELIQLVRNLTFESVNDLLQAVPVIDELSLDDVWRVRRTGAWNKYRASMAALLERPSLETFVDEERGAPAVVGAYQRMIREAERISLARRKEARQNRVQGIVQLAFDIGALTVNVVFLPNSSIVYDVVGDLGALIGRGIVNVAVRIGVGRLAESRSRERVDNSVKILELRLANPHNAALELIKNLANHPEWSSPRNGRDLSGADE